MQASKWTFNPGLAPTLATLLMFPLLLTLGFWQVDRADQKQTIHNQYLDQAGREPVNLNKAVTTMGLQDDLLYRQAQVTGRYADVGVFLLDNQVLSSEPGYFVYTPFRVSELDQWIMINRGWVRAGDYRDKPPEITDAPDDLVLSGQVTAYPSPSEFLFDEAMQNVQQLAPGIVRVQTASQALFEDLLGHGVTPYVLRLDPSSPSGFTRNWPQPGSGKERNLGYAFQWFALSAVLLVIYISVNLQHRKQE